MIAQLKRSVFVVLVMFGLSACGISTGELLKDTFWDNSPTKENAEAELGLAELTKGNNITAEGHFMKALKSNPKDVHALMGLGILYQNTGQLTKAREMYEAVIAQRPQESELFLVWKTLDTRPIKDIASVNLALLESGGVLTSMGRGAAGQEDAEKFRPGDAMLQARPQIASPAMQAPAAPGMRSQSVQPIKSLSDESANIVSRFKTLMALRDQGLITQEEFATRRQANVGSLLPLTSPPPAAGLDRPVPNTGQISGRLRAIGRALEMRAITITQHTAERSMILDALMPAAPVVVANPGVPPQGLMQAADAVRGLEFLRDSGYITSDEYSKERASIEKAMQPEPMRPKMTAAAAKPQMLDKKEEAKPKGPQPAVHIASYRSQKAAERGWAQMKRAHRSLLGNLDHEITRVNLGRGKGTYWRLKAGPVADKGAAASLCRKLKRRRLSYCEPSVINM